MPILVRAPSATGLTPRRVTVRKWFAGRTPEDGPPDEVIETVYDQVGRTPLAWVTERVYRQGQLASTRRYLAIL